MWNPPRPPIPAAYAGFWERGLAFLIDGVILLAINIGIYLGIEVLSICVTGHILSEGIAISEFFMFFVHWIYYAGMESSIKQATIGKTAMGIVVTNLYGYRISFGKATIRHFSKILSSLLFGIGFLMIAFTKRKQGLHDMVAECLVVMKEPCAVKGLPESHQDKDRYISTYTFRP